MQQAPPLASLPEVATRHQAQTLGHHQVRPPSSNTDKQQIQLQNLRMGYGFTRVLVNCFSSTIAVARCWLQKDLAPAGFT
jgi:hypothetical protein